MPYGTIKVDNITFTDNSVDKTVSLSGLIQNPTFTGNVTVTGTISGDVIRGGTTISGVTVTGTTANFVSGVFTTQVSGTTITGTTVATTTGSFVSLTGTTATFTSGIIASGTAALPSLAILSDPNTGIYSPGADQLAISTNGTEKLIVKSDGKVGIGTSPSQLLHVKADQAAYTWARIDNQSSSASAYSGLQLGAFGNSCGIAIGSSAANSNSLAFVTDAGGSNSEKLRITSAGLVGIGTSAPEAALQVGGTTDASQIRIYGGTAGSTYPELMLYGGSSAHNWTIRGNHNVDLRIAKGTLGSYGSDLVTITAAGAVGIGTMIPARLLHVAGSGVSASVFSTDTASEYSTILRNAATSGNNGFALFETETTPTIRGSITYNRGGGVVAYNITSDYRAKTLLGAVENPGETIDALKVYRGVMNGATVERPMLVAHEAQEVAPYCVTGEKDAEDDNGNPIYQQMDHQVLIPLLITEIQQLRIRLSALEGA